MAKEFKTIEELVKLLESRGVATNKNTYSAIAQESYYAIVNGYKRPFLDLNAMSSTEGDVYKDGVEFQWMYDLFLFDRDLRVLTFQYLAKAEAVIRSAVVYSFCHNHQQGTDYLDISNYCSASDYLVPKSYKQNKVKQHGSNLSSLMTTLNKRLIVKPKTRPFIKHYMNKYGFVPLWVLSNDLTFGNVINLYQLMQPNDRDEVCRVVSQKVV